MNKEELISTSELCLAQIRYYEKDKSATEIPELKAYAILLNNAGLFLNIFDENHEELPVYVRVPYSNTTLDGEDFGSKLFLANGMEVSGKCYVVEELGLFDYFGYENVHIEDIEDFIMKSDLFFPDRVFLFKELDESNKNIYGDKNLKDKDMLRKLNLYLLTKDNTCNGMVKRLKI